jgi:phosphoribosylamine--glycine ligase
MGAYSPAPVMTPDLLEEVRTRMLDPTVAGMAAEGTPYCGVLYAGVMVTPEGPKLVEYNARFGDPECQVLMLRLAGDLLPYLLACARGRLADMPPLEWRDEAALCVVMAAPGYPEAPVTGSQIRGADADFGPAVTVFQAGTRRDAAGDLRAAGGRVLNICARDPDVAEARRLAYAAVDAVDWPEGFCRRDIAWRALTR